MDWSCGSDWGGGGGEGKSGDWHCWKNHHLGQKNICLTNYYLHYFETEQYSCLTMSPKEAYIIYEEKLLSNVYQGLFPWG